MILSGTIDRRLLVNFAVEPEILEKILPQPFRPKVVAGQGVAGICLIRLSHLGPSRLPFELGVTSENAAHRIAVVWNSKGVEREGVFIPRRDTSSRLNTLLGGRVFPGVHHHASFNVEESEPRYRVGFHSKDGVVTVAVSGSVTDDLPSGSIFPCLEEVSRFFEMGSIGYSASADPRRFEGLVLRTSDWLVRPFKVTEVESSFFDDVSRFPPGTVRFDNALIMNRIQCEWRALQDLRSDISRGVADRSLAGSTPAMDTAL